MGASEKSFQWYGDQPVQSETGVDLTLLRSNLQRSLEQRFADNVRLFQLAKELAPRSRPMSEKELDPKAILTQLIDHQVEFVLIGGLAMIAQGSTHFTKDLDICYGRAPANVQALSTAFAPLHPYMRGVPAGLPFRFDAATITAGLNFTLVTDAGDVDVLGEVSGVGRYEDALACSEVRDLYTYRINVLSLDGLIAAKQAAGRVKDKLHLLELEELKKMRDQGQLPG